MLSLGNLSAIMYPMSADVYYSTETQNDIGEIVSSWSKDRSIKCSAIKERPTSTIANVVDSQKFIEYNTLLDFRTDIDILIDSEGIMHYFTEIVISNITDPLGKVVWAETASDPTDFEPQNIEPMYDPLHNFLGYRIRLKRADDQSCIQ